MAKFRFTLNGRSKWFGETNLKKKEITINKPKAKAKGKLLETIYHETLHAKHPRMHEKTVYKLEKRSKTLSRKEKSKLYAKINQKTKTS